MEANFKVAQRDPSASLGMTVFFMLFFPLCGMAQEPTLAPTASQAPARSVRISFVPPPLEGKISLGIFDENDQLVRVLHQEADLDEFSAGADALVTKWDGKDDFGYDLYPGTYHARGFLVGPMKIEELTTGEAVMPADAQPVKIRLMANPLEKNERPSVQLVAGVDDEDVLLKTANGLPLLIVTQGADLKRVVLMSDPDKKSATVFVETGNATRRFSVAGLSRMMAFDCGKFELK